jgi:DNA-binding GntR family transcriptional regulator
MNDLSTFRRADTSWSRGKRLKPSENLALVKKVLVNFPPVNPEQSYARQIYQRLYQCIIEGELPPGTPLSEQTLVQVFNVSRTPIHSALQLLVLDELIWIFPQSRTVVAPVRYGKLKEGVFVRCALETANLRLLLQCLNDRHFSLLDMNLKAQEIAVKTLNHREFTHYDDQFHQYLFEFSGHGEIWKFLIPLKKQLDRFRHLLTANIPKHIELAFEEHQAVFNALKRRDEPNLIRLIEHHVATINDHVHKLPRSVLEQYLIK